MVPPFPVLSRLARLLLTAVVLLLLWTTLARAQAPVLSQTIRGETTARHPTANTTDTASARFSVRTSVDSTTSSLDTVAGSYVLTSRTYFSPVAGLDSLRIRYGRPAAGGEVPVARGIPFGPYNVGSTLKTTGLFSGTTGDVGPGGLVRQLSEARTKRIGILTSLTGGEKTQNFKPGGDRFDLATWKKRMDAYNTPAIRQAVFGAVADGTLIGNSVMDEPYVYGLGDGNTHGPQGTMTKATVDQMCAYSKAILPTLPAGVVHQPQLFEPGISYRVCEFIVAQYEHRFGDVKKFRDGALAQARRDGIAVAFSMNVLNGGIQAKRDGKWACDPKATGGRGTYEPNCRMTPAQVREWGITLGKAGCALMMWRYDDAFMAKPDNAQAFRDVADTLATVPAKPCRRVA